MGKCLGALVKVKNQINEDKLAIHYTPLNFCYAHWPRPSSSNMVSPLAQGRCKETRAIVLWTTDWQKLFKGLMHISGRHFGIKIISYL